MEYLALYAYELGCSAIPAAFALAVLGARLKQDEKDVSTISLLVAVTCIAYFSLMLHFTGAGTLHDIMRYGVDPNPHQLSLALFAGFMEDIEGHMLNVLLFVPLGLFIPLLSRDNCKAQAIVLSAAAMSVAIELSQLLNSRITDVDDLIMNVLGALLGYMVYRIMQNALGRKPREGSAPYVALALAAIAFFGRFLLYDELGAAKILFGF